MSGTGRTIWVQNLTEPQRRVAKTSFTTRRVPREAMLTLVGGAVRPCPGDLVLARVERLGNHRKLERPDGRRAALHPGDSVIVTYGDRYAPDQFESHVPRTLGPTQLVASGGIASEVLTRNRQVRRATDIVPVGLIGDDRGRPLNVVDFALRPVPPPATRPRTIAVLGTSMNSGKTTTNRFLVHGFSRAGMRPGAVKVTGTGSGGDYWVMVDAGAHLTLDFTDVGLVSTYRQSMPTVERVMGELVDHVTAAGCDVNLVEIADGLYQRETSQLVQGAAFRSLVDAVVFAAPDAMGAVAGVAHLRDLGVEVAAVSGAITRSPLATREAEAVLDVPVLTLDQLTDSAAMGALLGVPVTAPVAAEPVPTWPEALPGTTEAEELATKGEVIDLTSQPAAEPVVRPTSLLGRLTPQLAQ